MQVMVEKICAETADDVRDVRMTRVNDHGKRRRHACTYAMETFL